MTPTEPDLLHGLVHDRIRDLLHDRLWYRTNRYADWSEQRKSTDIELRALLALARSARRAAEAERVVRVDPIDLAKRFADWSQGELAEAFGR